MKAVLFILLFAGILLTLGGFVLKSSQPGGMWQGMIAGGLALEAISAGLLLWKYVVKPQMRKS